MDRFGVDKVLNYFFCLNFNLFLIKLTLLFDGIGIRKSFIDDMIMNINNLFGGIIKNKCRIFWVKEWATSSLNSYAILVNMS